MRKVENHWIMARKTKKSKVMREDSFSENLVMVPSSKNENAVQGRGKETWACIRLVEELFHKVC